MHIFDTEKRVKISTFILILVLVLLYSFFHYQYMPEYIDDAWTFSWAYNYWNNGEVYDHVFGYLDGDGGTSLFSRTYVFVYGAFASIFGWNRGSGYALSLFLTFASAFFWFRVIRELGYSFRIALIFVLVMLLLEAYLGMAHKLRVEPLTFLCVSAAFLLFIKRQYFFSGLLSGVSVEVHPYGIVVILYIFAYFFLLYPDMKKEPKRYLTGAFLFISGLVLASVYYLALHYPYLDALGDLKGRIIGNTLVQYYFQKRFSWRHIPELIAAIAAFVIFLVKRYHRLDKFILPFLFLSIASSILIPRGNSHYIIYIYPAFILLLVYVFDKLQLSTLLIIGLLFFQLPQYGILYYWNRDYRHGEYVQKIRDVVGATEYPVYGNPNAWFALQEKEFYAYGYWSRASIGIDEYPSTFYYIENEEYRSSEQGKWWKTRMEEHYQFIEETTLTDYQGEYIRVFLVTRETGGEDN